MEPRIYSTYDPPPGQVLLCSEESRTRQSEAAACNINNIMARYETTGVLPVQDRQGFFADVSTMGDYRQAMDQVDRGEKAFMQLPAKVRSRFNNDAADFLDFVSDPTNRDEMREMGLLEPLVEPAETPIEEPSEPVVD